MAATSAKKPWPLWVKVFGLTDGFMMMGVAFLLELRGVVIDRQTVADQDAAEVFSQNVAQQVTSAALSNDIKGEPLSGKTHSHQPGPATHQLVSSL